MRRFSTLAAVAILAAAGSTASAAMTALFDFGNNAQSYRGVPTPSPDLNGHHWNSLQPGLFYASGTLKDITGAATTMQLGFQAGTGVGTDSYNGPAGATDSGTPASHVADTDIDAVALGNLGVKEAAFDFAASNAGAPAQFQLQGLDPTKKYTLTLFGSHKFNFDANTRYQVFNAETYALADRIGVADLQVHDPDSPWLHNRDKVATIANLTPDVNGILYVQFEGITDGIGGGQGYLNAFQITDVVPEPATLAAMGAAGALLVRRRR